MLITESQTDSRVVVLDWQNMKILASMVFCYTQITKVSFNPRDDSQIVTTGVQHWRCWKMQDGTFRVL